MQVEVKVAMIAAFAGIGLAIFELIFFGYKMRKNSKYDNFNYRTKKQYDIEIEILRDITKKLSNMINCCTNLNIRTEIFLGDIKEINRTKLTNASNSIDEMKAVLGESIIFINNNIVVDLEVIIEHCHHQLTYFITDKFDDDTVVNMSEKSELYKRNDMILLLKKDIDVKLRSYKESLRISE